VDNCTSLIASRQSAFQVIDHFIDLHRIAPSRMTPKRS
jgi:hypothetical protein